MEQDEFLHEVPPAGGGTFAPDLHDTHHLWLKAILLAVWVVVSFGACFFARDLQLLAGDWPLGYWMAAQGAVLMFMLIVVVYCGAMDRFERRDMTLDHRDVASGDCGHMTTDDVRRK